MRMNALNATKLYTIIEGTKQISRVPFTLIDFKNWLHTINAVNALPHGMMMLNGYPVSEYQIPATFKDLIVPSRIQFSSSDIATDFKSSIYAEADDLEESVILTPIQFSLVSIGINGVKKKNSETLSVISEMRVSKTLTDVLERSYKGGTGMCKPGTTSYCPVAIELGLFLAPVYTETIDSMLEKWFLEKMLSI